MTRREDAAILTGLRLLQNALEDPETLRHDPVYDVLTDAGELEPLLIDEINRLCERINTSDEYTVE